jgi:two-component system chemotaxis response regulator CheY
VNAEVTRDGQMQHGAEALVVEDDPDARRLLAACLGRLGLRVHEAATASSAIAALECLTPDVLCVDLRLPDGSGFTICEHVRRTPRLRDVPVLVISALSQPIDRDQAQAAGADGYLTKPIRASALAQSVRELLALSAVAGS